MKTLSRLLVIAFIFGLIVGCGGSSSSDGGLAISGRLQSTRGIFTLSFVRSLQQGSVVAGAQVCVLGFCDTTDENGDFTISVPPQNGAFFFEITNGSTTDEALVLLPPVGQGTLGVDLLLFDGGAVGQVTTSIPQADLSSIELSEQIEQGPCDAVTTQQLATARNETATSNQDACREFYDDLGNLPCLDPTIGDAFDTTESCPEAYNSTGYDYTEYFTCLKEEFACDGDMFVPPTGAGSGSNAFTCNCTVLVDPPVSVPDPSDESDDPLVEAPESGAGVLDIDIEGDSISFTHSISVTECPQIVGRFIVRNTGNVPVNLSYTPSTNALSVIDSKSDEPLAPGRFREVTVLFTCSQGSDVEGIVQVTATTAGGASTTGAVGVTGSVGFVGDSTDA